jgi:hypothetical protein
MKMTHIVCLDGSNFSAAVPVAIAVNEACAKARVKALASAGLAAGAANET